MLLEKKYFGMTRLVTLYSNLITYLVSSDKYVKLIRYAKVRYTLHLSLKSVFKAWYKHWNSNHVFWETEKKNQNNKVGNWMNIWGKFPVMLVLLKSCSNQVKYCWFIWFKCTSHKKVQNKISPSYFYCYQNKNIQFQASKWRGKDLCLG